MATKQITIPDIGDSDSVEIIEILVSVGDQVAVEDSLLTLQSDKASMEIPSPVEGTITSIAVAVGDSVKEGDHIFDVEVSASASSPAKVASEPEATAPVAAEAPAPVRRATSAPAPSAPLA